MNSALYSLMSIGPIALLAALIGVPIYYLTYRSAPEPKKPLSVARYVLIAIGVGVLAYVVGTIVGISAACSSESAGNLCGLVGVFGVGPLLSAVAIFLYAHSSTKNARRVP
jgi:hypothetical protein